MRLFGLGPRRLLACLCLVALGASLAAAGFFHRALERAEREIAALRSDGQVQAERSAQDRVQLEKLARQLMQTSTERDRATEAVAAHEQLVAAQMKDIERLTAEREAVVAIAAVERTRLAAEQARLAAERDSAVVGAAVERDAVVEHAAAEQARLVVDREAVLEEAAAERQQFAEERDRAVAERDRAVAERDATVSEAHAAIRVLDAQTRSAVADVEKIIVSTGLEPARLVPEPNRIRRVGARGGPYIPWKEQVALADHADAGQAHALTQQLERLKALRDVMVRLPLVAPVTHAILSDGFGFRYDPVNGGGARHDGLDLRAVQDSAAYAPAAGTVIAAGWDGAFGNLIQVDHGFGVITRYAHLSRMLVHKGDVVAPRQQIGVVGATGRVTGTHLHYEIWINGQPRDPLKFIGAVSRPFAGFVRQ